MAKKNYYLDEKKENKLTCQSGFNLRGYKVFYNDKLIGEFKNRKELLQGQEYQLDDNNILSVKLHTGFGDELRLLLNGEPIKGSSSDPNHVIKEAFSFTLAIAILNIVIGLLGELFQIAFLQGLGIGIGSVIFGLIILFLSFGIKKRKMIAPFLIAIFLTLDIGLTFYVAVTEDITGSPTTGIVIKVFLIAYLIKAGLTIRKLNKQ